METQIEYEADKLQLLIIDDDVQVRSLIGDIGDEEAWVITEAQNGELGIEMVREFPDRFDIVLLDLNMPGISGMDVLPELLKYGRNLAVIVMTGYANVDAAVELMKRGAADLLEKPVAPEILITRIAKAQEISRMKRDWKEYLEDADSKIRERFARMEDSRRLTIFGLARLAEYRDEETGYHLERIASYVVELARKLAKMGFYRDVLHESYIIMLHDSAPLHDIGKVGIPDSILLKPEKLSEEEFETMKKHTIIGARTLEDVQSQVQDRNYLSVGIEVARSHHENFDGSGYPDNLKGTDIPLSARLLTVADYYDGLVTPRIYRAHAIPHDEVVEMIFRERGKKFDPDIVDCFLSCHNAIDKIRREYQDYIPGSRYLKASA